jgi:hypothetical protein
LASILKTIGRALYLPKLIAHVRSLGMPKPGSGGDAIAEANEDIVCQLHGIGNEITALAANGPQLLPDLRSSSASSEAGKQKREGEGVYATPPRGFPGQIEQHRTNVNQAGKWSLRKNTLGGS